MRIPLAFVTDRKVPSLQNWQPKRGTHHGLKSVVQYATEGLFAISTVNAMKHMVQGPDSFLLMLYGASHGNIMDLEALAWI